MEEKTATTGDKKTDVFMAKLDHQWMLYDPSDHSCKNTNKRRDVIYSKFPSEDLGMGSLLYSY